MTFTSVLTKPEEFDTLTTSPKNMRPTAFLRNLSFRYPARLSASSAVAPLPVQTQFDHQVSAELETLQSQKCEYGSASWLVHALEVSSTIQNIALESLSNSNSIVMLTDSDRKIIDEYLDRNVEMLDACNNLSEKLETIQKYVESLKIVSKLLELGNSNPTPTSLVRASCLLDSCEATEKSLKKCNSGSRKRSLSQNKQGQEVSELSEILAGSKAVAKMVCGVVELALSLKSKQLGLYSWSSSLYRKKKGMKEGTMMLMELRQTMMAARKLRDQVNTEQNGELSIGVEELKTRCGVLEKGIQPLEQGVKLLYKNLISLRMHLLDTLSQCPN